MVNVAHCSAKSYTPSPYIPDIQNYSVLGSPSSGIAQAVLALSCFRLVMAVNDELGLPSSQTLFSSRGRCKSLLAHRPRAPSS